MFSTLIYYGAGVKHLEDCPVEPYIPIYLLVGGCVGLLKVLSMLWMQVHVILFTALHTNINITSLLVLSLLRRLST